MSQPTLYLPDSYWWADHKDGATLYLRYGCAATVRAGQVRIVADGPFPEVVGPCSSVAQGKRFAERFIEARTGVGRWRCRQDWWDRRRERSAARARRLQAGLEGPSRGL